MDNKTKKSGTYLVFRLDHQLYGIDMSAVTQTIRSVELTNIPNCPPLLSGLLNLHGTIVPVINIRKQLQLNPKVITINDRIVVVTVKSLLAAFVCDDIEGIVAIDVQTSKNAVRIHPDLADVLSGVGRLNNKTVLIYDTKTLFPEEKIAQIHHKIKV